MVDGFVPKQKSADEATPQKDTFTEPSFTPPEEIKDTDKPSGFAEKSDKAREKSRNPFKSFDRIWSRLSRTKKILLGLSVLLILLAVFGSFYFLVLKQPPKANEVSVQRAKKVAPTTELSTLTGRTVPIGTNKTPVTGVMIENSPDSRPQSGLFDAGVVFEAVAEGGITRFLALYQDTKPGYVGPVRSARPYYLRWALGFDAAYAHVGGSPEALSDIKALGVKDLDQFHNSGAYQRVSSRYAPHNVYTSIDQLLGLEASKGWTSSTFTGFKRKKAAQAATPTASKININISSFLYNVQYAYSPPDNSYTRNMAGQAHNDEKAGKAIYPQVVIAMVTDKGIASDGLHTVYRTTGSGQAFIFQDGIVTVGTWTKPSERDQIVFKDSAGSEIGLNPGQTWITIVGAAGDVVYTP